MTQNTDQEIIQSVLAGNASDYALLVRRYKDRAFSLLRRMLRNEAATQDALQDSFVKTFRILSTFRQESSFATWFYKIVYTTGLTYLKKDKLALERFAELDEAGAVSTSETPEKISDAGERTEILNRLIGRLPAKTATAITLFYINECSVNETAKIMQVSEANIKVMLHRGRSALKEMIVNEQLEQELI